MLAIGTFWIVIFFMCFYFMDILDYTLVLLKVHQKGLKIEITTITDHDVLSYIGTQFQIS